MVPVFDEAGVFLLPGLQLINPKTISVNIRILDLNIAGICTKVIITKSNHLFVNYVQLLIFVHLV